MNIEQLESKFGAMGARLKVTQTTTARQVWRSRRWGNEPKDYTVDIRSDSRGPYFDISVPDEIDDSLEFMVMQAEPKIRHLLLSVRRSKPEPRLDRFLCGHDEREWFVAAVPGGASSVRQAMDALQPEAVHESLGRNQVSGRKRHSRKNRAFRRQGEWFFLPRPDLSAKGAFIRQNEPIRRGGGKPHLIDEVFRSGGGTVRVSWMHPNGITEAEYQALIASSEKARRTLWQLMRRNATVYARGAVRHSDHKTIVLPCWHQVVMNTEDSTPTMHRVAFLD